MSPSTEHDHLPVSREVCETKMKALESDVAHLRETLTDKVKALEANVTQRFTLNERALNTAADEAKERAKVINEWNGTVRDLITQFYKKGEVDLKIDAVNGRIQPLHDFRIEASTKASIRSVQISVAIAVLAIVLSALGLMARLVGH